MTEEEFVSYKDISSLKNELEGMKNKKDVSVKELHDIVERLADTMGEMLEVFGAAAEQLKLEDREAAAEAKKHEVIISKLDRILEQNKTIAEGMVSIVEMIKQRIIPPAKTREEMPAPDEDLFKPPRQQFLFKPKPEPMPFKPAMAYEMYPKPTMPNPPPYRSMPRDMPLEPIQPPSMNMPPPAPIPPPDFGSQMPPMEPEPPLDLDFPEEPSLDEEPKKKGLFGMFKR